MPRDIDAKQSVEISLLFIFLNLGKNMKKFKLFNSLAIAISLLGLPAISSTAFGADDVEEVVAVGSRREARSVGDSPAPVDIITGSDFVNQGAMDLPDLSLIHI